MQITVDAGLEISDENSVALPRLHNRKRKRMSKPRGAAATQWSEEETFILINVLHDDARKSGFNGNTISGARWKSVLDDFFQRSGKKNIDKYEDERVKSKYQRLKRQTKVFKELICTSGYGWDPDTNTSTCPADIWDNLLAHKGRQKDIYNKFRHQGLKHFNLLEEIFGKSIATGNDAIYSGLPEEQFNDATTMDPETVELDNDIDDSENVYQRVNTGSGTGSGKRPMVDTSMGTNSATSARRKKSRPTDIHEVFKTYLASKMMDRDAKEKKKLEQESAPADIDIYSEGVVITQLQYLVQNHNLPLDNLCLAVKEFKDSSVRKMFVHMDEPFQVQWFRDLGKH